MVADEVEIAYEGRALELVQEGDGQAVWDSDRLAQVVQNLSTNALKYSRAGSAVQVITRAEDAWVTIVVCNEGAPIPAETLSAIFEPFQRAVGQMSNSSRSVGLGLYIVEQIVDAHHGSVEVHSSEADGTRFTVRLPRASRPG